MTFGRFEIPHAEVPDYQLDNRTSLSNVTGTKAEPVGDERMWSDIVVGFHASVLCADKAPVEQLWTESV